MLIDSHCHIDMVIQRGLEYHSISENLLRNKVQGFIQIGASPDEMLFSKKFAHESHPFQVWYTIGAHPGEAHEIDPKIGIRFARENKHDKKFVAVGEIGLDYFYGLDSAKAQQAVFADYLQLANELQKPVCIHTRDAVDDTIGQLTEHSPKKTLIHCFTGNKDDLRKFLDLDYYISFSGIVTFKKAQELQEAAKYCPVDKMLVETDAPYLAPVPHRGKTNEPAFVLHTLQFLAGLKEMEWESLAHTTRKNTIDFYEIEY